MGIDGLLDEYRKATMGTELWGPTFFSEVLNKVQNLMDSDGYLGCPFYHVLLFLTDGNIHDLRETIDAMVYASNYPISIIIVGIGDEDFDMMIELDSDDKALKDDKNNEAKRDIVQFVKYDQSIEMGNLGVEVLKEIPAQVCRYMEMVGYEPKKVNADMSKI